jgi:diacylglycerol kinase family enzyme
MCVGQVDETGTTVQVKPAMRRVALIYNPVSGQYSARRKSAIEETLAVLRDAGVTAEAMETKKAGEATIHARQAMNDGCDAVLACGGDGTVHEILQSLVGAPAKVARKLLEAEPTRISVGRIHYQDHTGNPGSRYFVVAAGIGADALVMSRMDAGLKRRLGYVLYLLECFRTWATFSFPYFEAVLPENGNGGGRVVDVSQLLAVRVRSFGGVLNQLAPGASLNNCNLSLLAFKTQSRMHYLKFLLAAMAGRHTFTGVVELLETPSIECRAHNGAHERLLVEADGEVLGCLPVRLEVVPHSLTLLIPAGAQP